MSFPRYERYKDSGVEWLGEVPEHWSIRRMKTLFEIKKRIAGVIGYDILSITQNGIKVKDTESNEGQIAMDYAKYQFVYPGDFAMNHMDLLTGYVDISKVEGVTSPDYRVFSIRKMTDCHPSYFLRLFQSAYHQKIFYAFGQGASQFGRWRLPTEAFNDFAVPYPPLSEQVLIGDFLDRETAKIDSLIEEQRRLIDLLKEKRQAVISHAVTKGISPAGALRASGVKWLGAVPPSWGVLPIKWVARVESGHTPDKKIDSYWEGGDIPWVSLNDTGYLRDHDYIAETAYYTTADGLSNSSARLLPAGDVVFSRDVTIGRCAITTRPMAVSQHFIAWICGERILPEFLLKVCDAMQSELERLCTGATIKTIGMTDIGSLVTPLPSLTAQAQIVEYIAACLKQIDTLISESTKARDLLQERRSALISAAVTGKIDVRGYNPKEAA